MPYIEILSSVDVDPQAKRKLVGAITNAITTEFSVGSDAVTVFFQPFSPDCYGYRGELGHAGEPRLFLKIYAYRRTARHRAAVAGPISAAVAACFGTSEHSVGIYFFEQGFDEVVHDGRLVSEGPLPAL